MKKGSYLCILIMHRKTCLIVDGPPWPLSSGCNDISGLHYVHIYIYYIHSYTLGIKGLYTLSQIT